MPLLRRVSTIIQLDVEFAGAFGGRSGEANVVMVAPPDRRTGPGGARQAQSRQLPTDQSRQSAKNADCNSNHEKVVRVHLTGKYEIASYAHEQRDN
jgi:hypothetical protein